MIPPSCRSALRMPNERATSNGFSVGSSSPAASCICDIALIGQRQLGGNPDVVPDGHLADFLNQRTQLNVFEGHRPVLLDERRQVGAKRVEILHLSRAFAGAKQQHDL